MKLQCHKNDLRAALATAERMVGRNLSLPALANLYLSAKGRLVTIRATNLDIGVELSIPASVANEGEALISGSVVGNFLGNLSKEETVSLEQVANTLHLKAGKTASAVTTYPTDDFPSIPRLSDGTVVKLEARQLVNAVKTVWYASSLSDIKPEIASVYLYQDGGDLVTVATDSFRLAEKKVSLDQKITEPMKLIIPFKNAVELVRVFESVEDEVALTFNTNQFTVESNHIFFSSRLVDGIYPDYRQIVPTTAATRATLSKQEFHNALKIANIFSDKLNQITLRVQPEKSRFELYARNSEVGESTTELAATIEGDDIEVSYNVKYLLDCFQSVATDNLEVAWNGKHKPMTLKPVGDPSFLYLVMPLNR